MMTTVSSVKLKIRTVVEQREQWYARVELVLTDDDMERTALYLGETLADTPQLAKAKAEQHAQRVLAHLTAMVGAVTE